MKFGWNRVIVLLMTVLMVNSSFQATVTAAETNLIEENMIVATSDDGTVEETNGVIHQTRTYVNPIYADGVQPSDLLVAEENGISVLEEVDYCTTLEEAGTIMRQKMVNREETITVYYQTIDDDYSKIMHLISDTAMCHTGVPVEGDYLKFQYAGWNSELVGYVRDGTYYYTITYTVTYYTTASQENTMNRAVSDILERMDVKNESEYEKIKTVYDYICENVTYDYDNLSDESYKLKFTAYAALLNKTAVCQGYAVLCYRLLEELGVDCRVIAGTGNGGPHAWNIARINNSYYNMDATWDAGGSSYDYFLKSTENFKNHNRSKEYSDATFENEYPMGAEDYVYMEEESTKLTIISQPDDYIGEIGETAHFSLEAAGDGLTYQWYYCNPRSSTWKRSSMSGYDTTELAVPITEARIGQKYRCVILDKNGNELITSEAKILKPEEEFAIISHPENFIGNVDEEARFSVKATGEGLKYQWQYCNPGSKIWKKSSMPGYKTEELAVKITEARIDQKYRCVILDKNGNELITSEAKILKPEEEFAIVSHPENFIGNVDEEARFSVKATGEGLKYQWQYCNPGSKTWKKSSMPGYKTAELIVKITEARIGQKYRCVITNKNGNDIISNEAIIIKMI